MAGEALLYFESDTDPAHRLADRCGLRAQPIARHNFPDGEFKLQLPCPLPAHVVVFRSLDRPNEKLLELLLAAKTAQQMGVRRLTLIAPYLAYMRQDTAFVAGESVSQKIVGDLLASLFHAVITVDPHLHRVARLQEAVPVDQAVVVSAAPVLGALAAEKRSNPFLIGPDRESEQWVAQAALPHGLDYAVAQKIRHGDHQVEITLPTVDVQGRHVVLIDDIASSGHTLAVAAQQLLAAGARSVDVAVTHALFNGDALQVIGRAGVDQIWSTDCVAHSTNAVSIFPAIAQAWKSLPTFSKDDA